MCYLAPVISVDYPGGGNQMNPMEKLRWSAQVAGW
jgi:hypothetical protein